MLHFNHSSGAWKRPFDIWHNFSLAKTCVQFCQTGLGIVLVLKGKFNLDLGLRRKRLFVQ